MRKPKVILFMSFVRGVGRTEAAKCLTATLNRQGHVAAFCPLGNSARTAPPETMLRRMLESGKYRGITGTSTKAEFLVVDVEPAWYRSLAGCCELAELTVIATTAEAVSVYCAEALGRHIEGSGEHPAPPWRVLLTGSEDLEEPSQMDSVRARLGPLGDRLLSARVPTSPERPRAKRKPPSVMTSDAAAAGYRRLLAELRGSYPEIFSEPLSSQSITRS